MYSTATYTDHHHGLRFETANGSSPDGNAVIMIITQRIQSLDSILYHSELEERAFQTPMAAQDRFQTHNFSLKELCHADMERVSPLRTRPSIAELLTNVQKSQPNSFISQSPDML
jgi:hypothetical protein